MELVLRFDYGHVVPWVRRMREYRLAVAGPDASGSTPACRCTGEDLTTRASFAVGPRATRSRSCSRGTRRTSPSRRRSTRRWRSKETARGGARGWAAATPSDPLVRRSLLTLKALTYAPTGGIVAAATTSLPEKLGGVRNWDYRYCWLRDATLTLMALLSGGFEDEARAWRDWLLRAVAGDPRDVQIMYGCAGERRLTELELDWLPGYEGSSPVRDRQRRVEAVPARRVRRGDGRAAARRRARARGRRACVAASSARSSTSSRAHGTSRTRASGRCAARAGTSCTRR